MLRFLKITIVFGLLIIFSCTPNNVIPKKELVPILVKICLTDATVASTDYRLRLSNNDTIEYYAQIIESFGFTNAEFDSTLSYYSRNPKEFDAIYDKVIFELSKIETSVSEASKTAQDSILLEENTNIWTLRPSYDILLDSPQDLIIFEFPVVGLGSYTLSYNITIFPDDESLRPQLKFYFFYDDNTDLGDVSEYKTIPYTKDGKEREINIKLELKNSLVTHIKGIILDYNNTDRNFRNHASVSHIKLLYSPFEDKPKRELKVDKELKPE